MCGSASWEACRSFRRGAQTEFRPRGSPLHAGCNERDDYETQKGARCGGVRSADTARNTRAVKSGKRPGHDPRGEGSAPWVPGQSDSVATTRSEHQRRTREPRPSEPLVVPPEHHRLGHPVPGLQSSSDEDRRRCHPSPHDRARRPVSAPHVHGTAVGLGALGRACRSKKKGPPGHRLR
jgi:hypothetical protein